MGENKAKPPIAMLISSLVNALWPLAMDLWEDWGIQGLVLLSFLFQIILAIYGRRRKYMNYFYVELIIWSSYLLATYIATLALGKLTVVNIRDPENPSYNVQLKGLLAPLLLIHLSFPDTMTAYSVEDNRLGIRQMLNLGVTIVFVVWILSRCWDLSSSISFLYIPLFIGGIIKSAGNVLALKSVYDDSISTEEMDSEEGRPQIVQNMPEKFKIGAGASSSMETILKAYYRFNCLRPHLVNWLYHPDFVMEPWMSIDGFSAEDAFTVTEVELGFMFDVLYTKAPILYTKLGLVGRFFSFLCLISALTGFSIIFRNAFLLDMYVTYTYALLIGTLIVELYQIALLPFTDWAIVQMCNRPKKLLVSKVLPIVVAICAKQKRWSSSMDQLNLLEYCSNGHFHAILKTMAKCFRQEDEFRRYWVSTREPIPLYLKEVVLKDMQTLECKRKLLPFTKRGDWTLDTYQIQDEVLKTSLGTAFDKSIIIWHVATSVLMQSDCEKSNNCHASELLSRYMMYLLARHPYMLSLTTTDITLEYASSMLKDFVEDKGSIRQALYALSQPASLPDPNFEKYRNTLITREWNVLSDAQTLARELRTMGPAVSKWELICSVWVEMLCYAAYNCQVYHHAEMLRRGGEFITHVWILLAHKTDKYHDATKPNKTVTKLASTSGSLSPRDKKKTTRCLERACC